MEIAHLNKILRFVSRLLPDEITFAEFKYTYYESSPVPICEVVTVVDDLVSFWDWPSLEVFGVETALAMGLEQLGYVPDELNIEFSLGFVDSSAYEPRWPNGQNWINLH